MCRPARRVGLGGSIWDCYWYKRDGQFSFHVYGSLTTVALFKVHFWTGRVLWHSFRDRPCANFQRVCDQGDYVMKWIEMNDRSGPKNGAANKCPDKDFERSYPAIAEFMCVHLDEGGELRDTATLMVSVDEGRFSVGFHDRHKLRWVWRSAETFVGALKAIEECLETGTADWRFKREFKAKK